MTEAEVESESEDTAEKEEPVDDDAGPAALEIEGQLMWFNFAEAVVALHRKCHPPSKDAPLLEVSISRHSGVLELTGLGIECIVQDDGGGSAKMFNKRGCWTTVAGIPRLHPWECKRIPKQVAPQHTAEIIMEVKDRLEWLGIKTAAELEKMNDKFLDVCLFSGQGRHGNLVMGHLPNCGAGGIYWMTQLRRRPTRRPTGSISKLNTTHPTISRQPRVGSEPAVSFSRHSIMPQSSSSWGLRPLLHRWPSQHSYRSRGISPVRCQGFRKLGV